MRILFIVPYAPGPVRVRSYEFIRTLARRGHHVTVAALWTSEEERDDLARLGQAGVTVLAEPMPTYRSMMNSAVTLFTRTPLQASYSWNPAMMARIEAALREGQFDAVHVEHLRGSRYAVGVRSFLSATPSVRRIPIVWDSVDSISYLFEQAVQATRSVKGRLMTQLELGRTRRREAWLVGKFERTLVTSELDRAAFVRLLNEFAADQARPLTARIDIIPNGVDLDHFAFRPPLDRTPDSVIFSGKMSYHANVTAALHLVNDIMPLVWAVRPNVQIWLVGKDPAPEVRKLAGEQPVSSPGSEPRVIVTGSVPSMPEYIGKAAVAVTPLLYGAGIQNKTLEAMACGTPVVATPLAAAALKVQSGCELLIADDAEALARALLSLLDDPTLRAAIGVQGRRYVEEHHSWDAVVQRLEDAYRTPPL